MSNMNDGRLSRDRDVLLRNGELLSQRLGLTVG